MGDPVEGQPFKLGANPIILLQGGGNRRPRCKVLHISFLMG